MLNKNLVDVTPMLLLKSIEKIYFNSTNDIKETKFIVPVIIHTKKNKPILPKRKLNGKNIQDAVNKLEGVN